jgi:hypothetical protein
LFQANHATTQEGDNMAQYNIYLRKETEAALNKYCKVRELSRGIAIGEILEAFLRKQGFLHE